MPVRVRLKKKMSGQRLFLFDTFNRQLYTLSIDKAAGRRAQWNKYTKQARGNLQKLNRIERSSIWNLRNFLLIFLFVPFFVDWFQWTVTFFTVEKKFCFFFYSNWYIYIVEYRCHSVGMVCTLFMFRLCVQLVQSAATSENDEMLQVCYLDSFYCWHYEMMFMFHEIIVFFVVR